MSTAIKGKPRGRERGRREEGGVDVSDRARTDVWIYLGIVVRSERLHESRTLDIALPRERERRV